MLELNVAASCLCSHITLSGLVLQVNSTTNQTQNGIFPSLFLNKNECAPSTKLCMNIHYAYTNENGTNNFDVNVSICLYNSHLNKTTKKKIQNKSSTVVTNSSKCFMTMNDRDSPNSHSSEIATDIQTYTTFYCWYSLLNGYALFQKTKKYQQQQPAPHQIHKFASRFCSHKRKHLSL